MLVSKASKRNIILFCCAFLLCGVLHIALYGVDFADCFSTVFCSILTLLWAGTIQKRIVDERLRMLMLLLAASFLFHFFLQFLRYEIVPDDNDFRRHLWYAMYIPMVAQPIICYYIASSIYREKNAPMPRFGLLLIAVGTLFTLGVLTNDLHFFFKAFPSGVMIDNNQAVRGWLYYAVQVFIYVLYTLSILIVLRKNYRYVAAKHRWLAFIPLLFGVIYFTSYTLDLWKPVFKTQPWNVGDAIAFIVSASVETCILVGMIPANSAYEALFTAAELPAVILDDEGNNVYMTKGAVYPFAKSEDFKIVSQPISGGSVEYLVDVRRVNELNRQIAERTQQIEARNAYLAEEARVKKERAEIETKNRIYESISGIVMPQLERIEALRDSPEGCGKKELAQIAVLKAFIKRRGNMELLKVGGALTVTELATAVSEELDYLRLCGVETASNALGSGAYPSEMIIAAYESIHSIVEQSLDSLSDIAIVIRASGDELTVRVMLRANSFSYFSADSKGKGVGFSRSVAVNKEDQDIIVTFCFTQGGVRV
ncbi:MAG: hypothetical protein IKZ82_03480 [Clostridia bacterium]|nr:hypothetical protein [Clostridia bacterium]